MKLNYFIWALVFAGVSFLAVTQVVTLDGEPVGALSNWYALTSFFTGFGSMFLLFAAFVQD